MAWKGGVQVAHDDERQMVGDWMQLYGSAVWAYLYAITKDHATTDDLAQDVFVQAYLNFTAFRAESSPKTWLFAIARNKAKDYFKSAFWRRIIPTDKLSDQGFETGISAEEEVIHFFSSHRLAEAVYQLKPIYREAVVLHVQEELTFREMASVTGTSESAVKVRYQRALVMLRQKLEREGLQYGVRRQDIF
ncbi:sigma-70 family RNA polymerase sigma factor [Alicyclobacillus curvatus]|nr:sigma-70 family RNA polymerase sigma factor [Alicyclobacillus curvatus]